MSRSPNEYHLVAFDPGGTIGWAHLTIDYRAFSRPENKVLRWIKNWDCGEFEGTEHEQLEAAVRLIWRARFGEMPYVSSTDVVCTGLSKSDILSEDFELTQLIGGKNLLSPVRCNAVLDFNCKRMGTNLILQRRSMRIQQTADRLIAFGFWPEEATSYPGRNWTKTGKGKDAFAAMQHAVTWVRRVKDVSRGKPWKLSRGGVANGQWDCTCERGRKCNLTHTR